MNKQLKGGPFNNRYIFKGILTANTPLHIGNGGMIERTGITDEKGNPLKISAIVVDNDGKHGKPYIPGSALRGVMRNWLRELWGEEDREDRDLKDAIGNKGMDAFIVAEKQTRMERLFGTIYSEGKVEVWDSPCISEVDTDTNSNWSGWDKRRLTYVAKSVAINPLTGTAEDKKLYNFELVPEGACFNITLTGQNLIDEDAALILHVLEGFGHPTSPLALGSMTKRGFGRFTLKKLAMYRLVKDEKRDDIKTWKELCKNDNKAGYDSICREEFKIKDIEIAKVKETVKYPATASVQLRTEWNLNLQTPLVVRSGSKFRYKNAAASKIRNYNIEYKWGQETTEYQIADLYSSLKIIGQEVKPYYHIPSSSIRGALREWTIKHLLPDEWWDIEECLKKHASNNASYNSLPKHMDDILSLFGFVVKTGNNSLDEKYTCAGRLTIEVTPFSENQSCPDVDGSWNTVGNIYGPTNAKRHIKTRNPLDRITNAARETGLHSALEFSKGQSFRVTLAVASPKKKSDSGQAGMTEDREQNEFDKKLIDWWCSEINAGMIRFGGLTSIGRGRVTVQEVKDVK